MGASKLFQHKDYELLCSAKAVDGGKFAPNAVASKRVWPTRPRDIAMRHGDYPTEEAAIEAAHGQAVEWVQNYG